MLKITIDTSVFIEDDEKNPKKEPSIRFRKISESLHRDGVIEVAVSTRFEADKETDRDLERVARHFARLEPYKREPAGFRFDVSLFDVDVFHGSLEDGDIIGELERLFTDGITSKRRRVHSMFDADHIWAHWAGKRDYLITGDAQAAGRLRGELSQRFGIRVMRPEEFFAAYEVALVAPGEIAKALAAELDRVQREGTK